MDKILITIDGPAAAGKTSVSRLVAKELSLKYVDTGALYRALAYFIMKKGIAFNDESCVSKNISGAVIKLDQSMVFLNGKDISSQIRTPEISMGASIISAYKDVRARLLELQKDIGRKKNAVFEGRDMGTVVFPYADFKFYLTADIGVRAKRRYLQLNENQENLHSFDEIFADLEKRDRQDMSRVNSPLKAASDAVIIDSTDIGIDEVCRQITDCITK